MSHRDSSSQSSSRDSDRQFTAVVPRSRQVLGGALGSSLISSSPQSSLQNSPRDDLARPVYSPVSDLSGQAVQSLIAKQQEQIVQVLTAKQQEQLEGYRRATEHYILDRHYALERSIERMLQDAFNSARSIQAVAPYVAESKLHDARETVPPVDMLAQIDKMFRESEVRASQERSLLVEQILSDSMRSIETLIESELNKQCDLIAELKDDADALPRMPRGSARRGTRKSTTSERNRSEKYDEESEQMEVVQQKKTGAGQDAHILSKTLGIEDEEKKGKEKEHREFPEERVEISHSRSTRSQKSDRSTWAKKQAEAIEQISSELGKAVGFRGKTKQTRELFAHHPKEAKNNLHDRIQRVAHSPIFVGIMEFCILINVGIKAVQMDLDVRRAVRNEQPVFWGYYVDLTFTGVFVLELILRIMSDHWWFFFGSQRAWNLFDLAVVSSSCFEILTDGLSIGFLRIFRSLRLVRVLKIVRVFRFFRELRLMAVSIASCMASLFWALVMMFIVILVFAMFVLEGSKNYMRDRKDGEDEVTRRQMVALYGSFPEAIYSLVQAISGGGDWGEFAAPLVEVSWVYGVGFALFVSFVTLGMMNILIGIFVENAQQYSALDRDLVIQEEMHQRRSYMNQLRDLFHEMDEDKSGTITYEEFNDCLSHERAQAYLDFLQLNASEAQGLFMLLDLDENGEVGVEEFVLGCMRLKGTAKSIDAASMMFQTKRLAVKLNEFFDYTRGRLDQLVAYFEDNSETTSMAVSAAPSESQATTKSMKKAVTFRPAKTETSLGI